MAYPMAAVSQVINIVPADALATPVARARFQKQSARDRLRYDPDQLIAFHKHRQRSAHQIEKLWN